jgi:hypothetical protein
LLQVVEAAVYRLFAMCGIARSLWILGKFGFTFVHETIIILVGTDLYLVYSASSSMGRAAWVLSPVGLAIGSIPGRYMGHVGGLCLGIVGGLPLVA